MSARHASWNMVTQQEIKVLVGFGCFFFFFFLKRKKIFSSTGFVVCFYRHYRMMLE